MGSQLGWDGNGFNCKGAQGILFGVIKNVLNLDRGALQSHVLQNQTSINDDHVRL
jgi:hypothetical protein